MTMYRLLYPRFWLGLGWAMVALVVVGSLVPGKMLAPLDYFLYDKVQHALAYATLMVCFAGIYRPRTYVLIAVALLGMGIGLEVLQLKYFSRDFDVRDMVANGIGIVLGLILARWLLEGWCVRLETLWLARSSAGSGEG
jgi:VanZ family protein